MTYEAKLGDVFLCDSNRISAKIVRFFMQAPTWYIWIWRFMMNAQQSVRYYHAGLILDNEQIIEQQSKVQYGSTQKILSRRITIYRKKSLTNELRTLIKERAISQLGQGYGIEDVIAHTLTWLTGIRLFVIIVGALSRNKDICVNRVARWYQHIDDFETKYWYEITTKSMNEYLSKSPDWEAVYTNDY